MKDKPLPHSVQHEMSLLSCMMLNPTVEGRLVLDEFGSDNPFYINENRHLYDIFLAIDMDKISMITMMDYIGNNSVPVSVTYLREVGNHVVSASQFELHLQWVKKMAVQRNMITGLDRCVNALMSQTVDVNEIVGVAKAAITDSLACTDGDMVSVADAGDSLYAQYSGGMAGFPSGYPRLDDYLCPIPPGSVVVIAARPKIGKTTKAINIALNLAKAGYPIGFISMEMQPEQITNKLIALEAGVDSNRRAFQEVYDSPEVQAAKGRVSNLPIYITSEKKFKKQQRIMRSWTEKKKIKYWFVDHIGLTMTGGNSNKNRENEVSEISKGYKELMMDTKCVMFELCQLNRSAEGVRPKLNHLRESGSIEQDADAVIFLHSERGGDEEIIKIREGKSVDLIVDVAAHRHGGSGYFTAQYYKKSGLIVDGYPDNFVPK